MPMPTLRRPRPPPHDRAGGRWRLLLPSPAATIHGRLVGEETEDSQLTAAVSSRLKTNLTRSLTHVWGLPHTPSHTRRLQLGARSLVRYLPIKRRRAARSVHLTKNTKARTHAHTRHKRAPARTCRCTTTTTIVLFMFADPFSSAPPLDNRPSALPPHRRCNKYKVHRRHCHRRRNMVLIRWPITDVRGTTTEHTRGFFAAELLFPLYIYNNNNTHTVTEILCGHPTFREYTDTKNVVFLPMIASNIDAYTAIIDCSFAHFPVVPSWFSVLCFLRGPCLTNANTYARAVHNSSANRMCSFQLF